MGLDVFGFAHSCRLCYVILCLSKINGRRSTRENISPVSTTSVLGLSELCEQLEAVWVVFFETALANDETETRYWQSFTLNIIDNELWTKGCDWTWNNLNVKSTELSLVLERVERGVDDLRHDRSDDAAEERLPAECLGPERRQVFHGEQKTSDRRVESSWHTGRHASRRELSSTATTDSKPFVAFKRPHDTTP